MPRFQDLDLMLRLSRLFKIAYLNYPLVHAYIQTDSITTNFTKAEKAYEMIIKKYNVCDSKYLAKIYYILGCISNTSNQKLKYYKKSLSFQFNAKCLLKYILKY